MVDVVKDKAMLGVTCIPAIQIIIYDPKEINVSGLMPSAEVVLKREVCRLKKLKTTVTTSVKVEVWPVVVT